MIEVKNLTKEYGTITAVDDISFEVNQGEIVGILGPNGAGKTTTLNIITGYITPTKGEITINGKNVLENPNEYKKMLGYLPENPPLYEDMTVKEYLKFVCEIKKVPNVLRIHKLDDVIKMTKLLEVKNQLIKNLSKGYKQRVGIAQALMGDPKVLVLDEPTIGLDPSQIIEMRNLIKRLGKERTIIISSHILPEVSAICDRIIIIDKGRIIAEDTPLNLSKSIEGSNKVFIKVQGDSNLVLDIFQSIPTIVKVNILQLRENSQHDFLLEAKSEKDTEEMRKEIVNKLILMSVAVLEMKINELTLEEIFLKFTNGDNQNKEVNKELEPESKLFEDEVDMKELEEEKPEEVEEKRVDLDVKEEDKQKEEQKEDEQEKEEEEIKKEDLEEKEDKKNEKEQKEQYKNLTNLEEIKEDKVEIAKKEYEEKINTKARKEKVDKEFWGDDEEDDE